MTHEELTDLMTDYGYTLKEQEYFRELATMWLTAKRKTLKCDAPTFIECEACEAQKQIVDELLSEVQIQSREGTQK